MSTQKNTSNIFANFMWRFAERCGAQIVTFLVTVILARLLSPEEYGIAAILSVFINILSVFVDSGLGNALIQKKDADDADFSTVFYVNILFCSLVYMALFYFAPWVAVLYDDSSMTLLIRVSGISLLIAGIKNIQQAYIAKNMLFKNFFYATICGTIGSAFVGIGLALNEYGVWALVAQGLTNEIIDTLILWIMVKWRPHKVFSLSKLKVLFTYGWKLLASSLINAIYGNLRQLIIGKIYTSKDLAFYNKAQQISDMFVTNVNGSVESVLLPVMASVQDEGARLKEMTRRAIKVNFFVMTPIFVGLAVVAEGVVKILFTEKWLSCIPFLRIFCVTSIFSPIHSANLNALKAMGRSDLFFRLEVIKKIIDLLILLITMKQGMLVMAYSLLLSSILSQILNSWPSKELLHYSYLEQLRDVMPILMISLLMGCVIYPIKLIGLSDFITLVCQVCAGAIFYIVLSIICKIDSLQYVWRIIKNCVSKISIK